MNLSSRSFRSSSMRLPNPARICAVVGTTFVASVVGLSPVAQASSRLRAKAVVSQFACNSDVTFYSTSLTRSTATTLCNRLETTRKEFERVFNDGRPMVNAPDDLTTGVDFYVFKDNAEYVAGGRRFDYSTSSSDPDSNAGVMFERNALKAGNHAFIATRAFGAHMTDIENLEHEFAHYLTFRYLAPGDLDLPVWLTEGLAEYLGNPQDFDDAKQATIDERYRLSDVLSNVDTDDSDLVYNAGHLAVEYFLNERPGETAALFDAIDQNDPSAIDAWTDSIGTAFDDDFTSWLSG